MAKRLLDSWIRKDLALLSMSNLYSDSTSASTLLSTKLSNIKGSVCVYVCTVTHVHTHKPYTQNVFPLSFVVLVHCYSSNIYWAPLCAKHCTWCWEFKLKTQFLLSRAWSGVEDLPQTDHYNNMSWEKCWWRQRRGSDQGSAGRASPPVGMSESG